MFNSQPKHVGAGMMYGVRDIGLGVLGGVATLVAAPVVGASKEGATGFVKVHCTSKCAITHLKSIYL